LRRRLLVGRENDLRAGHGVGQGLMVVESDPEMPADIGQLGRMDVPGAPGKSRRSVFLARFPSSLVRRALVSRRLSAEPYSSWVEGEQ